TGLRYRNVTKEIEVKELRLAKARSYTPERKDAVSSPSTEEYAFARQTASRLSVPWNELFLALEASATEQVALLAIEPDIENRTINISGEAKTYLAALTYVARLSEQGRVLANVRLFSHEIKAKAPERPVAFGISATWAERS